MMHAGPMDSVPISFETAPGLGEKPGRLASPRPLPIRGVSGLLRLFAVPGEAAGSGRSLVVREGSSGWGRPEWIGDMV